MKRESTQEAQEMSEDAKCILKVYPSFGPIASHADVVVFLAVTIKPPCTST